MKNVKKIISVKSKLMEIDSAKINEDILYLLNKARTSPKSFSKYLNINENEDAKIIQLFNFFINYPFKVAPLIEEKNLSVCSKDLLEHIITGDLDEENILNQKSLKKRLERLNLVPINYNNFIILDAEDSLEALINLFLNDNYRNTILDPDVKYIGIASGPLQTGNLCIIIDIVQSLKCINRIYSKSIGKTKYDLDNYNNTVKKTYNLSTNYTDKKIGKNKRIFENEFDINNNINDLQCKNINKGRFILTRDIYSDYYDFRYKYPISVYIKKRYVRDDDGNLHLLYNRESNYDDGSKLIQFDI